MESNKEKVVYFSSNFFILTLQPCTKTSTYRIYIKHLTSPDKIYTSRGEI